MTPPETGNLKPKPFIPEARIETRLREIAAEINRDYAGKELTAICILKGSFIFFCDLIRLLDMPLTCEFLGVSSYGNQMVSSGEVKVTLDLTEPVEGRHLLIVEDIVDSGLTLEFILQTLRARRPASLRTCSLLFKPGSLKANIDVDYTGFRIGSEFVVGYGLDYAEKFRGLPFIGIIENEH
jgi:hypoxanthine phosphoribosyltransferase